MRDQFGIKPKVKTYSYRTPYPPAYDLISLGKIIHQPWNMSIVSLFNVER
jgi:hypothetical protein